MPKIPECPSIDDELIKYLDAMFKDECADLKDTDRQIFYKSGQRSVVKHLIEQQKEQQEK